MIKIYDNAFSFSYAEKVFGMVKIANYWLGWEDSIAIEHAHRPNLYSIFEAQDIANLGILEELKKHEVGKLVNFDASINTLRCIVNLSCPGQTNIEHTHANLDVVLYYVNPIWNRMWAGETLFYSENRVELERAVEYVPNRLVFFNGEHPHTIRSPSFEASFYRFTISLFFNRE